MPDVVVIGCGGFGREVLDVIEAHNASIPEKNSNEKINVLGVADDSPTSINLQRLHTRNYSLIGSIDELLTHHSPANYVVGIGNTSVRARISQRMDAAGWSPLTVIHPTARMGSECSVGQGSVICSGVQLTTNISLGRHVHVNLNATIGHDSRIGDFVSINPSGMISGEVSIESGTLIGVGGIVLEGIRVGMNSTVGAGACVVRDVIAGSTVVGIPARPLLRKSALAGVEQV